MDWSHQQLLFTGIGAGAALLLGVAVTLARHWRQLRRRYHQQAERLTHLLRDRQALAQENARLQAQLAERERQYQAQSGLLAEHKVQMKQEFENLAHQIFEHRSQAFDSQSHLSLDHLLTPFREQIQGFQQRIEQVHTESVRSQASLAGELQKVLDIGLEMNAQASRLSSALRGDNKAAGSWGEAQLERSLQLAGLQRGVHYEAQAALQDGAGQRRQPDFLIKLPDGKHLVIDSKVSLLDYERAVSAASDEAREVALAAHARSVRQHVSDLARKDYARLDQVDSPDFVLMFLPVEPAYIEALRRNPTLYNDAFQQGVALVSHTTLMPIMRTVANLWMVEHSHREAREISTRAGEVYNQVSLVAERLQKLGNSLRTTGNHYNDTVRALAGKQGLQGKVERFQQLSARAADTRPEVSPVHLDLEQERLQSLTGEGDPVAETDKVTNT